jgi:hypothetical protein
MEDARRLIQQYVDRYNTVRLHSAIGFITPADMLAGASSGDPRGTRPQAGGRTPAAAKAPQQVT